MQNIEFKIKNKIICENKITKIIKKITIMLKHNFLDSTISKSRNLILKVEISELNT